MAVMSVGSGLKAAYNLDCQWQGTPSSKILPPEGLERIARKQNDEFVQATINSACVPLEDGDALFFHEF